MSPARASLASLIALPAAGISAGGSFPTSRNCAVNKPFLPRNCTRTASSAARSWAALTADRAFASSSATLLTASSSGCVELGGERFLRSGDQGGEALLIVNGDV